MNYMSKCKKCGKFKKVGGIIELRKAGNVIETEKVEICEKCFSDIKKNLEQN